ncbi:uncharacterized protein SETTUDRAFT_180236 [Exserohilum turcica Et28A]|uniref:Uncharacterized protein n=1 Tax=Exserohilum turcicum (strain 28A) TaxID=671987 RepID=R0K7D7_EXST2|nr:uncharacterized protein SETTUDRAFT_180236 [Exserohilum turcica Et28A]EOA84177.1 hypothetical protein SETTUDRAFT_180236 [Exserohilum turcica Et28A]
MAGRGSSDSQADQTPEKTTGTRARRTRRKLCLVVITILLNVLLYSALLCIAASVYQIISDPRDTSIYTQVALDTTSALATVAYTLVHTIVSLRQKSWDHTSSTRRTSNIALRMVAWLCALWLLTSGWNMILVARRPICSQRATGLDSWEYGSTCLASRIGIITAALALGVSCVLFGILATVSRPLEAHLFNHGYQPSITVYSKPYNPRPSTSQDRPQYLGVIHEKQGRPISLRGISESNPSTGNVRMINPGWRPGSSIMSGHSTIHTADTEVVFTSNLKPPPIPAQYITSQCKPWLGISAPAGQTTRAHNHSASSSRSSLCGDYSRSSRQSLPAQWPESALRAVHPNPESLILVARSRSQGPGTGFSYKNPYSRSLISLTRPTRLSYASSGASISSRHGRTGSDSSDDSSRKSSTHERAGSDEIVRALVKGIPLPVTAHPSNRAGSMHITTKLNTDSGVQPHHLAYVTTALTIPPNNVGFSGDHSMQGSEYEEGSEEHRNHVRSISPGYSMLFSPDSSPTDDVNPNESPERVAVSQTPRNPSPVRRQDSVRTSSALIAAEAVKAMINKMPQDLTLPEHKSARVKVGPGKPNEVEKIKNKPLYRVAYM